MRVHNFSCLKSKYRVFSEILIHKLLKTKPMQLMLLFCIVLGCCSLGYTVTLTRCQLAKKLLNLGFVKSTLPDWVCLAESESALRTEVIGPVNDDGSYDYGIFQINSRYWCRGTRGPSESNGCNINCNSLLSDDITNSARCAQTIFNQSGRGYTPWYGWIAKCQNKPLPDLSNCFGEL